MSDYENNNFNEENVTPVGSGEDGYTQAGNPYSQVDNGYTQAGNPYSQADNGYTQVGNQYYEDRQHAYQAYSPIPEDKPKKSGAFKRAGRYIGKVALTALIFGTVAGTAFAGISIAKDQLYTSKASQITLATSPSKEGDSNSATTNNAVLHDISSIVDQVMPSVVSITCTIQTQSFFGPSQSSGAGSGFIIARTEKELMIATNNHVVANATSLNVGFADGTTATATVVGTDADADLGVISVKLEDISDKTASAIKVAVLGDSNKLKVGEPVIAIGNALGYGQSVTTGVVSAKDREISFADGTMTLLQTDAAINPGNSGGVLCNIKGEVIGINNAKLEDTSVEGMGYAIPMETAQTILTDLMNRTEIKEGDEAYLGILGKTIDQSYSNALGMPTGIYVTQVVSGSPAEAAGICAGDVITAFDGKEVSTMDGLRSKIGNKKNGTEVSITLKRANQNGEYQEQTLKVTLGKKSDYEDASQEATNNGNSGDNNNNYNQPNEGNNNPYYYYYGNGDDSQSDDDYFDPFSYFFGNGGSGDSGSGSPYDYFFNH